MMICLTNFWGLLSPPLKSCDLRLTMEDAASWREKSQEEWKTEVDMIHDFHDDMTIFIYMKKMYHIVM